MLQQRFSSTMLGLALLLASTWTSAAAAADQVAVRFSWKKKGEYAFFYLAQAKGLYAANDLSVTLGEGAGAPATLSGLLQGQSDVAIMPGIFAISAALRGMPIKIIALYHPQSPVVIISQPSNPVLQPRDLENKSIATSVGETGTSYLDDFALRNKVDPSKIRKVQVDAQARVAQFLTGQVDMVSVYTTNDLPLIEKRTGKTYPRLDMPRFGFTVPGLAVVTSDEILSRKRDVLTRYLKATGQALEATRMDATSAVRALVDAWPEAPPADVVEAQVRATIDAVPIRTGKPAGWVDAASIATGVELVRREEGTGPAVSDNPIFTNELLQ